MTIALSHLKVTGLKPRQWYSYIGVTKIVQSRQLSCVVSLAINLLAFPQYILLLGN